MSSIGALQKKLAARRLWELCFEDSALFVDFYFEQIYPQAWTYLEFSDEVSSEAIAQMQVIPYAYQIWEQQCSAGYISGACTAPSYRSKGIMAKMLRTALNEMYQKRLDLSFLIPAEPWLFDYYRQKSAYVLSATREFSHVCRQESGRGLFRLVNSNPSYDFYVKSVQEAQAWLPILHSRDQWQAALFDLSLAGGQVFSLLDSNEAVLAQAYYVPQASDASIRLLLGDAEMQEILIQEILCSEALDGVSVLRPPRPQAKPYAMLRIVHATRVLALYAEQNPDAELRFSLLDEQIPANSGHYEVFASKLRFSPDPTLSRGMGMAELSERIIPALSCTPALMMD